MRTLFVCLTLLLFISLADAQMQLANPVNEKVFINKKLKKKAKRKKAVIENFVPFDLRGGLIFVSAKMNGRLDSFVLDTGAPALLLNKKVHIDSSNAMATDITGNLRLQNVVIPNFKIGNVCSQRVNAYCLDLSHLENIKKHHIEGMIGYEQVKDSELFIDYQRQELMLLQPETSIYPDRLERTGFIPFKMQKHFVVVIAKVGGEKLKFGIDTGAEVNLLSTKAFKKIESKLVFEQDSVKIRGVKDKALNTQKITIPKTIIKRKNYKDMPYVVMDMGAMNEIYGLKLDGILGYPFLASQKFSINYTNNKMYIWKDVLPYNLNPDKEDVLAIGEGK